MDANGGKKHRKRERETHTYVLCLWKCGLGFRSQQRDSVKQAGCKGSRFKFFEIGIFRLEFQIQNSKREGTAGTASTLCRTLRLGAVGGTALLGVWA
jgi:hypothetical protein